MKQLIIGGARSGKSRLAESWILAHSGKVAPFYIATAALNDCDEEMHARISHHRYQRDERWQLIEEPHYLGNQLKKLNHFDAPVLVDCLTLWLSNCLARGIWQREKAMFLQAVTEFQGDLVLVSNEVGLGLVPMGELNRQFIDESGFLHQALASLCERVVFTVAGLPSVLKGDAWV